MDNTIFEPVEGAPAYDLLPKTQEYIQYVIGANNVIG